MTLMLILKLAVLPALESNACGVEIKVISSTEKERAIHEIAEYYNAEQKRRWPLACSDVKVVGVSSGIAEQLLANPNDDDKAITLVDRNNVAGAQVWLPSSTLWLERLKRKKENEKQPAEALRSIARSPMVLAMPRDLADKKSWSKRPPTWLDAINLLKSGSINYTQEDPRSSTSGSMATYLTFAAGLAHTENAKDLEPRSVTADQVASISEYVQGVQSAATGGFLFDSTEILKGWSKQGEPPNDTIFMIQEQMVWGFNSGQYSDGENIPPAPLVAVHPVADKDGRNESLVADHPYVKLPGMSADQKLVAQDFLNFVLKDEKKVLCRAGFRAPEGASPAECQVPDGAERSRIDLDSDFRTLDLPDIEAQEKMVDQWRVLKSPRHILIAMDVSGTIKDDDHILTAGAVKKSILKLRSKDQVGVHQFAGRNNSVDPYWEALKLAEKSTITEGDLAKLSNLPRGDQRQKTALFVTADYVFTEMSNHPKEHQTGSPKPLDVVIIISDGNNDWDNGPQSADDFCREWKDNRGLASVSVHTIYYTPKSDNTEQTGDKKNLEKLASCTTDLRGSLSGSVKDAESLERALSRIMRGL